MILKVEIREIKGKKNASLRRKGLMPAVLYGYGEKEARSLSVDAKEFKKIWKAAGESTLFDLAVGSDKKGVMIKNVAVHPLNGEPLHVDFYAVRLDKPITASVPVVFEGESSAVKNQGGILVKVMYEIEVEALPRDLPSEVVVDISALANFNDQLIARDIKLKNGVELKTNPEDVIVLVKQPVEEKAETTERTLEDIEVEAKGKQETEEGAAEAAPEEKK